MLKKIYIHTHRTLSLRDNEHGGIIASCAVAHPLLVIVVASLQNASSSLGTDCAVGGVVAYSPYPVVTRQVVVGHRR